MHFVDQMDEVLALALERPLPAAMPAETEVLAAVRRRRRCRRICLRRNKTVGRKACRCLSGTRNLQDVRFSTLVMRHPFILLAK